MKAKEKSQERKALSEHSPEVKKPPVIKAKPSQLGLSEQKKKLKQMDKLDSELATLLNRPQNLTRIQNAYKSSLLQKSKAKKDPKKYPSPGPISLPENTSLPYIYSQNRMLKMDYKN
jgi:hypothetical protein